MNITFLVGNGFDISAGIDTSYSGFYKWYCAQESDQRNPEPEWIKEFKNNILEDMKKPLKDRTWADFELGLGEYTKYFQKSTLGRFVDCYEDAVTNLQKYIELQIEGKVKNIASAQKEAFSRGLLKFPDELPDVPREMINQLLPPQIKEDIWYRFISFNYTAVLDEFVKATSTISLTHWTKGATYYAKVDPNVLHIHGSIDDMPLMGVNDKEQIKNDELREDIDLQQYLVKPVASSALGELVQQKAKEWIQKSNIICLWGLSIGETDSQWWKEIMGWLSKDKAHQLVVFWYTGGKVTKRLHTKILKERKKVLGKLFSYSTYTSQEIEELQKRINVVIDTQKVLRVTLSNKEKELVVSGN